jgi:hypothetical protein
MVMELNFSAFAMGIHAWLGADSVVRMLGDESTREDSNNPPHFDLLKDVVKGLLQRVCQLSNSVKCSHTLTAN